MIGFLLGFGRDKKNDIVERNKKVVLFLSKILQEKGYGIEGKKKLMKLMFLVEHYDPDREKIVPERSVGNEFFVYNYGVFSIEVLKAIDELLKEGYLEGEYPDVRVSVEKIRDVDTEMDKKLVHRIEKIVDKFGKETGWELERDTLRLLGIDYFDKERYKGLSVEEILS